MIGKSSWSSVASSAANRSNTSLTTSLGLASGLSTLLMQTMGLRPIFSALPTTNLVCGMGPSAASTSTIAPSTIDRMRSTSPPKSAWPGVSTMLMRMSFQTTEVALARMVMPRSRSRSLESITRSATRWLSRKAPDCCSSRSTRVVLPWSTWAMMAMLRSFLGMGRCSRAPGDHRRCQRGAKAAGMRRWATKTRRLAILRAHTRNASPREGRLRGRGAKAGRAGSADGALSNSRAPATPRSTDRARPIHSAAPGGGGAAVQSL